MNAQQLSLTRLRKWALIVGVFLGIISYILYYLPTRQGGFDMLHIFSYGNYLGRSLVALGIGIGWKNWVVKRFIFFNFSLYWFIIFLMYVHYGMFGSSETEGANLLSINTHLIFIVILTSTIIQLCLLIPRLYRWLSSLLRRALK